MDGGLFEVIVIGSVALIAGLAAAIASYWSEVEKAQQERESAARLRHNLGQDSAHAAQPAVHFPPATVNFKDLLMMGRQVERSIGILQVFDDRIEIASDDSGPRFTFQAQHLREMTLLTPLSDARRIKFALYSETDTGWRVDKLSVASRDGCEAFISAVQKISGLTPTVNPGIGPITALGYRQDMLGHWERGAETTVYLITKYLIVDWQNSIQMKAVREVGVHPSPGSDTLAATALLVVRHMAPGGHLQTDGFDLAAEEAYTWAQELHQRSGAPLDIIVERKRKAGA